MLKMHVPSGLIRANRNCSKINWAHYPAYSMEQCGRVSDLLYQFSRLGHDMLSTAYPVSPRWMNDLGLSVSDLTWNAAQSVAFVSRGERADQCMLGTAVIVYVLSFWPGRESVCLVSCHQLMRIYIRNRR